MNSQDLKLRAKRFALRIIKLVQALPKDTVANVIGKQLIRCGTSVGANYRASCRAKSRPDFILKMTIVEEECDEYLYWMELLIEAALINESKLQALMAEANEILAMTVASINTARSKMPQRGSKTQPFRNPQSEIRNKTTC